RRHGHEPALPGAPRPARGRLRRTGRTPQDSRRREMARKVTDAMLMAYVDGELEPPASRDISDAIAADPQLKARAETFAATRRLARAAFKPELASPAPARLVEAIAGTAEPKREHRVLRRLFASREAAVALPMAASIAVACLAGG